MSHIMKMGKPNRYESIKEEEFDEEEDEEEFDEEDEEEEFDDDSFDEEEEEEFEKKLVTKFDPNTIILKLQKADWRSDCVKFMKIDREIELRWLMIQYCDSMGMEYRNTKFMFNGACLRNTDTPLKLSMVDRDVIYVGLRSNNQGADPRSPIWYETLCIRAHKGKDTFVRVTRHEPLLRQIKRNFSDSGNGKHCSTCFFYKGNKLNDHYTANLLRIEDGDIIDAFNFDENRSSLSFVTGLPPFKGNPGINKTGPPVNVLGTPGSYPRPRKPQLRSNPPVQQQATRLRPPPVVMYEPRPPYPGTKRDKTKLV